MQGHTTDEAREFAGKAVRKMNEMENLASNRYLMSRYLQPSNIESIQNTVHPTSSKIPHRIPESPDYTKTSNKATVCYHWKQWCWETFLTQRPTCLLYSSTLIPAPHSSLTTPLSQHPPPNSTKPQTRHPPHLSPPDQTQTIPTHPPAHPPMAQTAHNSGFSECPSS